MAKLEAQVDRLLMPPPLDNTLIAAGTLLDISQGPQAFTKKDKQLQQLSPKKGRSGTTGRKLQNRRKAKRPLKLGLQPMAKMHMGPRDEHHSQELAKMARAMVPLQQWETAADDINGNIPRPETPGPPRSTQKVNKIKYEH